MFHQWFGERMRILVIRKEIPPVLKRSAAQSFFNRIVEEVYRAGSAVFGGRLAAPAKRRHKNRATMARVGIVGSGEFGYALRLE